MGQMGHLGFLILNFSFSGNKKMKKDNFGNTNVSFKPSQMSHLSHLSPRITQYHITPNQYDDSLENIGDNR